MPRTSDHRITIRLKPDEYALLTEKAGRQALGTFVRDLALDKAAAKRKPNIAAPLQDTKALAQTLALLGTHKLVRAFKQADLDVANGTRAVDDETKQLIRECYALLAQIRALLMKALGRGKQ